MQEAAATEEDVAGGCRVGGPVGCSVECFVESERATTSLNEARVSSHTVTGGGGGSITRATDTIKSLQLLLALCFESGHLSSPLFSTCPQPTKKSADISVNCLGRCNVPREISIIK